MKESKTTNKKELLKELQELAKQLNDENILFLIQQAQTIIHNNNIVIQHKENQQITTTIKAQPFYVELNADKKSAILIIKGQRKIVVLEELRALIRLSHTKDSNKLFEYLKKERSDILKDGSIANANDPILKEMLNYINNHYKEKK